MLIDIYIITLLFIVGILMGYINRIIAIKMPLKVKEYVNGCDKCNTKYKWYQLIPLLSFILQKGKCPYCKKNISFIYQILEIISGLLFALSYIFYGFSYEMIVMIVLTNLGILIYITDFKYYIILDEPLIFYSILILICKFIFFGYKTFLISVCSGLLIFVFMVVVQFIGNRIFKQESIGGGDIKLSMFFGFLLGVRLSIVSLILGSFLAFPCAVYYSISGVKREIPFGPFLITGLYLVFVFMEPIRNILTILF